VPYRAPTDFDAALAWWRERVPMLESDFYALSARARRKAFTVAGVAQLDLVTDVYRSLERAIAEGKSLTDWKLEVGERLRNAWAGTVRKPGHRLETIYRTNVQLAYGAGRYYAMTGDSALEARPIWVFDAVLDSRTTVGCRALDGVTLRWDDPFWTRNYPPRHFRCRSGVRALPESDVTLTDMSTRSRVQADPGFGRLPDSDEYTFTPDPFKYPAELWRGYLKHQAAADERSLERTGKINQKTALKEARKLTKRAGFELVVHDGNSARFKTRDRRSVFAEYDELDGKIHLNLVNPFWKDVQAASAAFFEDRYFSTPDPYHVVHHEIGHARQIVAAGLALNRFSFPPGFPQELEALVSTRATVSPTEWVAEVYAALAVGRTFGDKHEDVVKYFLEMKGVMP
jgi:SPP1 gp7 family putative phage head morphogenesis protein